MSALGYIEVQQCVFEEHAQAANTCIKLTGEAQRALDKNPFLPECKKCQFGTNFTCLTKPAISIKPIFLLIFLYAKCI